MELKCKSCGFEGMNRFLELGNIPPVNAFIQESEVSKEKAYPLNLAYCPNCYLVQLEEIVPPEELFRNYLHLSSGSESNINHLKEVASYIKDKFKIDESTKILEIGSNDGTLLSFFKPYTKNILGVDPAKNLSDLNKEKQIEYISEFFDTKTASKIVKEKGKYDILLALNVIPHTPNNIDLLKAARLVMKDSGVLVMEGVYALDTVLRGEFDTIYHEHVYTFSLHSLISTFRMAGLTIVDVEKIPTQGGSLRISAMKDEYAKPVSESVNKLLSEEKLIGLDNQQVYSEANKKVENYRKEIRELIEREKLSNGKLIGLGAPARGVVMMNYIGITPNDLDYVVDDTVLKQGRLVPGVHVPVMSTDSLKKEKGNKTFILFSWNYKDSFIRRLKEIMPSFKVIIPFPELKVEEF